MNDQRIEARAPLGREDADGPRPDWSRRRRGRRRSPSACRPARPARAPCRGADSGPPLPRVAHVENRRQVRLPCHTSRAGGVVGRRPTARQASPSWRMNGFPARRSPKLPLRSTRSPASTRRSRAAFSAIFGRNGARHPGRSGRFAAEELAPLNRAGDRVGARLENGSVSTAPGWREAYRRVRATPAGAGSPPPEAFGGQGLPVMIGMAVQEIWNAGAAGLRGRADADRGRHRGASRRTLRRRSRSAICRSSSPGEWMATMNLTEPQAGSDLGAVRTRAERAGDGTYRMFGQKIFITYRRARLHRQHHPSGARPPRPTRRQARAASRFSWCRSCSSTTTARSARATTSSVPASSTSSACTARRPARWSMAARRGRRRLAGRRGEPRARLHVHHDEQRPPRRRHPGRRRRRARLSDEALAYARERRQGRPPGAPVGA